jgi:hypothetical protein
MRTRVSYANVVSTLALVVALGGTGAYAAGLAKNSVTSKQIKNGTIKAVDIKNDAVTGGQVKESTLGKVPSAAKVDGITRIRVSKADNPTSTTPLFTRGPLQVSLFCDFAPTGASLRLSTTADNSTWATDTALDEDFDVADGFTSMAVAYGNGTGMKHVAFAATGADGTSVTVSGSVRAKNNTCTVDLHVLG